MLLLILGLQQDILVPTCCLYFYGLAGVMTVIAFVLFVGDDPFGKSLRV